MAEHPNKDGEYIPLFEYSNNVDFNPKDLMPNWTEEEKTYFQFYENFSCGTPKSPPMPTIESLAQWLTDNDDDHGKPHFNPTITYKRWFSFINRKLKNI